MKRRLLLSGLALGALLAATACSDAGETPLTLVPPTRATVLEADTTPGDGGSGDTTADEQADACSDIARAFYAATGASGAAATVRPLYDAVTPLLPEALRADWSLAADAFVAYEDAAVAVPDGEEQLDDPTVRAAYERATSDEVQAALQRVREGIEAECPGTIDDTTVTQPVTEPTPTS